MLKGLLRSEVGNFLDLTVAVRLLLSPDLVNHYLDFAGYLHLLRMTAMTRKTEK